jgi:hypothetical protein
MVSQSLILGSIKGISKKDYDQLKFNLQECFDKVVWKDHTIFIRSERRHSGIKRMFGKIADRIAEGQYGSLLYVGNDKVVCIYFGHKKFVGKQYREPRPPAWWGVGDHQ